MTSRYTGFGLSLLLLLPGCHQEQAAEAPRGQPAPVTGARVETAALAPLRDTLDAVGTVRSKTRMLIASKVQGYVREVRVRQGDQVEPGALLVTVDPRDLVARVDRARAALADAEMALDEVKMTQGEAEAALRATEADHAYGDATAARYRELRQRDLISAQDYEVVEAKRKSAAAAVEQAHARLRSLRAREAQMRYRIDQARAELRTTELALDDTRLTAPASGVVVERRVEPGDLAVPGQPLLVLDDPRVYRFEAEVGESAVGRVRLGQTVPIVLDALARTVEGRVAEIVPAADPTSRTVTVKVDLPADPELRTGLFGRARFPAGERQALVVPRTAVVERGQLSSVFVVDTQNIAQLRLVTPGPRHGDRVEILSGLRAGERIVVEGVERVTDGARVVAGSS